MYKFITKCGRCKNEGKITEGEDIIYEIKKLSDYGNETFGIYICHDCNVEYTEFKKAVEDYIITLKTRFLNGELNEP